MSDCIFCRILAGELPASFIYRDDRSAAFMDIQPVNPGHLRLIPVRLRLAVPKCAMQMLPKVERDSAERHLIFAADHEVVSRPKALLNSFASD